MTHRITRRAHLPQDAAVSRVGVTWRLITRRPVHIAIEGRRIRAPRLWIIRHVLLKKETPR